MHIDAALPTPTLVWAKNPTLVCLCVAVFVGETLKTQRPRDFKYQPNNAVFKLQSSLSLQKVLDTCKRY